MLTQKNLFSELRYASWRRLWIAGERGDVDDVEMMAMLIQACWRGYSLRRDLRRVLRNEHAATAIQALWRGALRRKRRGAVRKRTRKENEERKIKTHSSSIEIQKACMNVWEEYVRFDRKSRQALKFTLGTHRYGAARLDTADEAISLLWNEMSSLRKWVETSGGGDGVLKEKSSNVVSRRSPEVVKLRREVKSLRSEVSDLKQMVNALLSSR